MRPRPTLLAICLSLIVAPVALAHRTPGQERGTPYTGTIDVRRDVRHQGAPPAGYLRTGARDYRLRDAARLSPLDGLRVVLRGRVSRDGLLTVRSGSVRVVRRGDFTHALTRARLVREARREGVASPRRAAAHAISGERRVAVLLVNFPDDARTPFTATEARQAIFTGASSVSAYYRAVSGGAVGLRGVVNPAGDVFGWLRLSGPAGLVCDPGRWGDEARGIAAAQGVDLSVYDHIVYIWPPTHCDGTSFGTQRPLAGFADPSLVPQAWIDGDISLRAVAHELGHNLGLMHAYGVTCRRGTDRVAVSPVCFPLEYQDPFGVMGGTDAVGAGEWAFEIGARQRAQLGWLPESRSELVTTSRAVAIEPLELPGTGLAEVRIPHCGSTDGSPQYYSIEYRRPVRFDAGLPGEAPSGVYVRVVRASDVFDQPGSPETLSRVFLVDSRPETDSYLDAGLLAGDRFVDPEDGLDLRVTATTPSSATVSVALPADVSPPGAPTITSAAVGVAPGIPQRLASASPRSPRGVALNWRSTFDCGLPAAAYRLLRDGVPIATTAGTSFVDLGAAALPVQATASYAVQSIDGTGNASAASAVASVVVPDLSPPTAPTGLVARVVSGTPELAWSASRDNVGVVYVIYRDGERVASTESARYVDAGGSAGRRYQVLAADIAGNVSAPTAVVEAVPPKATEGTSPPRSRVVGTFVLNRRGAVLIVVRSGGRRLGEIVLRGHVGRNRVILPARIGGRALRPGTYRLELRSAGRARLRSARRLVVRLR